MSSAPADAGFVLLDALMATALAAFAGGTVIMISNGMLTRQGEELDRSVALVMSQSLMRQHVVLGVASDVEDELFRYEIAKTGAVEGTTSLQAMAVIAEPKSNGLPVRLDFLGPLP